MVKTVEETKVEQTQLSFRVPVEHADAIRDFKWTAKKNVPDMYREAIADYVAKHNLIPATAE